MCLTFCSAYAYTSAPGACTAVRRCGTTCIASDHVCELATITLKRIVASAVLLLMLLPKEKSAVTAQDTTALPCLSAAGSYCPGVEGSSDVMPCPPGSFQPMTGQRTCLPCMENHYCPQSGTVKPEPCLDGMVAPLNSTACGSCDYALYYRVAVNPSSSSSSFPWEFTCKKKTPCNFQTHYERSVTQTQYEMQDTQCLPLTRCNIDRLQPTSPINGLT